MHTCSSIRNKYSSSLKLNLSFVKLTREKIMKLWVCRHEIQFRPRTKGRGPSLCPFQSKTAELSTEKSALQGAGEEDALFLTNEEIWTKIKDIFPLPFSDVMWGGIHGFSPPVVRERFARFYLMLEMKFHEIRSFPCGF